MVCSQGLADNAVISKVNGVLWDLDRPLEMNCKLELLKFDDPEAQAVFWHSSAHIMGEAMERIYGGCLCYGPPIESGFYYDMFLEDKGVRIANFHLIPTNFYLLRKIKSLPPIHHRNSLQNLFRYQIWISLTWNS